MIYPWLVFLHVISVLGFVMSHGISVGIYFSLHHERNADRIRLLLQNSSSSLGIMQFSLLLLLITGIITGFIGRWWGRGWIWLSIGILVVLFVAMEFLGVKMFNNIRLAVGLPSTRGQKPRAELASIEELGALLDHFQPFLLAGIGFGGLAVIAWLMMFKPF